MSMGNIYFHNVRNLVDIIEREEMPKIQTAAEKIADSTAAGGIVHLFGSGHSILAALEVFMRAGSFSNSKPIIKELEIDRFERIPGVGSAVMRNFDGRPGEVLVIFSNSGKNPLPVEVAQRGKEKGVFTVAITSFEHAEKARNGKIEVLADVVDLAIDTHVPYGDASVLIPGTTIKTGPLSTIANVTILHSIYCTAVEKLLEKDVVPPVRVSRNTPEGDAHNKHFADQYGDRIPDLRY
jgi:uncharacterized phosphosugar-binding protein